MYIVPFFPPIMVSQTGKRDNKRWSIAFLDFNTKEEAAHFMLSFDGTFVHPIGPGLLEAS